MKVIIIDVINEMNIYNNYTTTAENKYYQLIKTLIFVLEKRIVRFYQAKRCN